jgi:hypothetical protein
MHPVHLAGSYVPVATGSFAPKLPGEQIGVAAT